MQRKLNLTLLLGAGLLSFGLFSSPPAAAETGVASNCDFDGDSYEDLAIGTPSDSISGNNAAGFVNVIYGSKTAGLTSSGDQLLHQGALGLSNEEGDSFGAALACGDFDGDGFDDLAVGIPSEDDTHVNQGAVLVVWGSSSGLSTSASVELTRKLLEGTDDVNDFFGAALSTGDYDGDGIDDLAIGVPGQEVGAKRAGAVAIAYGDKTTPLTGSVDFFDQDTTGIAGDGAESGDQFGWTLTSGDFDGNGASDLAIAAPFEDGPEVDDGGVLVLYGQLSAGLTTFASQSLLASDLGITSAEDDRLGLALTAGDFDGDKNDDLAIGVPASDVSGLRMVGYVGVIYGSSSGLSATVETWDQSMTYVAGSPNTNDRFGAALAAGDFDKDGRDDLAIGIPGETVNSKVAAGAIHILPGTSGGLTDSGDQSRSQDSSGYQGVCETGDAFGSVLAVGDFDGNGYSDLGVGVFGESVGGLEGAGAAQAVYGSSSLLTSSGDQFWSQASSGILGTSEVNDAMSGPLMSAGIYAIPFAKGTKVTVGADHNRHPGHGELDISGASVDLQTVAAAADGTVMFVVDSNAEPTNSNNYIWIAHANGEWTKYTHIDTGTATVSVGDAVVQGQTIGTEGEVGRANGPHVHFEVAYPDDPTNALNSGGWIIGQSVTPRFCGVDGGVLITGETYTADSC